MAWSTRAWLKRAWSRTGVGRSRREALADLRESAARQRFVIELADTLRSSVDPIEILAAASALLGRRLGAGQVAYAEIDAAGEYATIERDWNDGSMPSNVGSHCLNDFGPEFIADLKRGRTVVIGDVHEDPRTATPAALATFAARSIGGFMNVPLMKDGRLRAVLAVHSRQARPWTAPDVVLARETAERTWDALERARAEAALAASEQRLRALVHATSYATYRVSPDWQQMREINGRGFIPELESPSDDWLTRYVPADDQMEVRNAIARATAQRSAFDLEHRILRADGTIGWTHSRAVPLLDERGEISEWFGTATDVSARRTAEEALRESERRLTLALEAGGCVGTWDWDVQKHLVHLDTRLATLFGFEHDASGTDAAPDRLAAALHPDDVARTLRAVRRAFVNGGDFEQEYRIVHHDGVERWVLARGHCIHDERGRPRRFLGVAVDISERKQAERHQQVLMAELDHRVKNILAVVQALAHQSLRDCDREAADRFAGRLAALARAHTLLADSRWQGASLRRLAEGALAPYRGPTGAARTAVSGPELRVAPRAAQTLTLAFHELATNAAKYGALTVPEGTIDLCWKLCNDDTEIVIEWREMNGPPVTMPVRRGRGSQLIELSVAYELAGRVELNYPRSGVLAEFRLPLAPSFTLVEEPEERPTPRTKRRTSSAQPRDVPLHDCRVLVVEDEHLVAAAIARMIETAGGVAVGPVPSVAAAIRVAEEEALDAAVLDVNLGGEFVWPVAEVLRRRSVPCVFATGYADTLRMPAHLSDAPRVGKPIDAAELIGALVQSPHSAARVPLPLHAREAAGQILRP